MVLGKYAHRFLDGVGFVLAAAFAVHQKWTLQEFCWSAWMAGLGFTWACIVTSGVQILLSARGEKAAYERRLPVLQQVPRDVFYGAVVILVVLAGGIAFRLYSQLFAFYGLFLSVFAEMQPESLFGRNGFINSDFFTPVTWLLQEYWPMVLGTLAAHGGQLVSRDPWKRMVLPFRVEVMRIHLMTLTLPFFSLAAWFLFGARYQQPTIVALMGLFFLLPRPGSGGEKVLPA